MSTKTLSPLRAWLQLVRPPNLFTVPGDPLAGYLIANAGIINASLWPAILSSIFLYAAGLIMNDLADRAEDARDRPGRPLPSGVVAAGPVWTVMAVLIVAGLGAAWMTGSRGSLASAAGLVAAIALYNFLTKHWPIAGALNMGLCRSLSVMIGACAGPIAILKMSIAFAVAVGLYIAAVTNLARHETRPAVPTLARVWPAVVFVLACVGGIFYASGSDSRTPVIFLNIFGIGAVAWLAVQMFQKPAPPLPPLIGAHIRLLLLLQAANCFLADPWVWGPVAAVVLLIFWPLSKAAARKFYAS